MRYGVYVCFQHPECENEIVEYMVTAINEEAADDTSNHLNFSSECPCDKCGRNLVYFSAPVIFE